MFSLWLFLTAAPCQHKVRWKPAHSLYLSRALAEYLAGTFQFMHTGAEALSKLIIMQSKKKRRKRVNYFSLTSDVQATNMIIRSTWKKTLLSKALTHRSCKTLA